MDNNDFYLDKIFIKIIENDTTFYLISFTTIDDNSVSNIYFRFITDRDLFFSSLVYFDTDEEAEYYFNKNRYEIENAARKICNN